MGERPPRHPPPHPGPLRPRGPEGSLRLRAERQLAEAAALEPVAPVHPAAGGDLAADGGDHAGRHRRLSVSAALGLARGRLSDDPGADLLSRRQPRCDDLVGDGAARSAVRPDAGPQPDVVDQLGRRLGHHPAVQPRARASMSPSRRSRRRSTRPAICCPSDLPAPPIYAKVNPADAPILTLALTSKTMPLTAGRGPRRHAPGAEDLAADRGRPRQHQRRPPPGGAHPGQSAPARRLWPQHRRSAHDARQRQRQHAQGQFRRAEPRLYTINANDQLQKASRLHAISWSPTATARR